MLLMVEYVQLHYRRQRCEEHELEEEVHMYICRGILCIWEHNDTYWIFDIQNASSIYMCYPLSSLSLLFSISLSLTHILSVEAKHCCTRARNMCCEDKGGMDTLVVHYYCVVCIYVMPVYLRSLYRLLNEASHLTAFCV